MAHVRELIVAAAVTRVTGLTTTGANVFADRPEAYALQETELPALLVYDFGDEAAEDGEWPTPIVRRTISIGVDAVAKQVSGLAALLRTMCSEVETALGAPLTVSGASVQLMYRGVRIDIAATSDRPVTVARMRFETTVYTYAGAPDAFA